MTLSIDISDLLQGAKPRRSHKSQPPPRPAPRPKWTPETLLLRITPQRCACGSTSFSAEPPILRLRRGDETRRMEIHPERLARYEGLPRQLVEAPTRFVPFCQECFLQSAQQSADAQLHPETKA